MSYHGSTIRLKVSIFTIFYIILFLLIFAASLVSAKPLSVSVLKLDDTEKTYPVSPYVQIFEDKTAQLTIKDVASPEYTERFVPASDLFKSYGYSSSVYWLRFTIENGQEPDHNLKNPERWILENRWRFFRDFTLITPITSNDGTKTEYEEHHAGGTWGWERYNLSGLPLLVNLPFELKSPTTFYLRADSWGVIVFDLVVQNREIYLKKEQSAKDLSFIYAGIIISLLLFNAFLWISLRDPSYLYYIGFVLFIGLGMFKATGPPIPYFSSAYPETDDRLIQVLTAFSHLFFLLFSRNLLKLKGLMPHINQVLILIAVSYLILIASAFHLSFPALETSIYLIGIILAVLLLTISLYLWMDGYRPARYYFLANVSMIIGFILFTLGINNLAPIRPIIGIIGIQVGSAIQAILFSLALADRIRHLRNERATIKEQYQNLYENIQELLLTTDMDGRILSVNPAVESLFGQTENQLAGQPLTSFIPEKYRHHFLDEFIPKIKVAGLKEGLMLAIGAENKIDVIEYRSVLKHETTGQTVIIGTGRIISQRILAEKELSKLQDQLLQAQKMEAVGTLAAGMTHDFNNLLQSMTGALSLLKADNSLLPKQHHYLDIITSAAERGVNLVKQIMTLDHEIKIQASPVSLNQIIMETLSFHEKSWGTNIRTRTSYTKSLPKILGDHFKLQEAMMNLCLNARDAMPEGGELSIESFFTAPSNYWPYPEVSPGHYSVIKISDNGVGIPGNIRRKIFEPFFTTKEVGKGTGLGLSMVFAIVKSHKGFILCDSAPGKGTSFTLFFPSTGVSGEQKSPAPFSAPLAIDGSGHTILIVEDETYIREILTEALLMNGFHVLEAENGQQAIAVYELHQERVDLVIMDMNMPVMNGRKCMNILHSINPDLPIIITSGSMDIPEFDKTKANIGFINKPYTSAELLKTVREFQIIKSRPASHDVSLQDYPIGMASRPIL